MHEKCKWDWHIMAVYVTSCHEWAAGQAFGLRYDLHEYCNGGWHIMTVHMIDTCLDCVYCRLHLRAVDAMCVKNWVG